MKKISIKNSKKKVITELLEKKFEKLNAINGGTACPCKTRQTCISICTCPPCCGSTPDRA